MEADRRMMMSSRRAKRLAQQSKTHPIVQAKQNQMYLITSLGQPPNDNSVINRTLPSELILRIFSFLDHKTLCRCAQVCRSWNILALDGSNWQIVDLFTFQKDVKTMVIENLARRCGGFLKELSLKGCENVHDSALKTFTAKCHNLERLSLYRCKRVSDQSCENLGKNCHKLKHLNLENCEAITNRAMKYIGDGCKQLTYLNISWCEAIHDHGVQQILINCPNMNTLILRGCDGLTDQVFAPLQENMKNLKKLNMLQCTHVNDNTVKNFAKGAKQLEYLCLSSCTEITDRALMSIGANLQHLKVLEVAGCGALSDAGFVPLAKGCRSLERLDLEDCQNISDQSIIALSTYCGALKELSLSHCELITDDAIHNLCAKHRESIEVLEVDNCPMLSDASLSHLRHCRVLKRIDLYDCQGVSKESIIRFKNHRPNVEIHAYFAPPTPPADAVANRSGICRCCIIL